MQTGMAAAAAMTLYLGLFLGLQGVGKGAGL